MSLVEKEVEEEEEEEEEKGLSDFTPPSFLAMVVGWRREKVGGRAGTRAGGWLV